MFSIVRKRILSLIYMIKKNKDDAEWKEFFQKRFDFFYPLWKEYKKQGFIGGNFDNYKWAIVSQNGDIFFQVNNKSLPMKKTYRDVVFKFNKKSVSYTNLENFIFHFVEELNKDKKSPFYLQNKHIFEEIVKNN